ncbi:MAG: fasciclin domain-containing protein [Prevotella sp.]|nr:fasciclin domain-containing protein [Prevotella sp.]
MITNKIKNLFASSLVCCAICAVTTACSDWDDHYDVSKSADGSGATLWQQMQQLEELSDFCQVLQETKVFRMHKKTTVSYADLLNSGQSFTVVAPKNGTFDRDNLIRLTQTNQGDSVVEKSFVLNHLSRSTTSMKSVEQDMLLLNSKHVLLKDNTIQGIRVSQANCHAKNGVLHITDGPLPYNHNLYEALCDLPELSGIGAFLRQYEEDYFDADNSVSSGIVEGVPVYVDSVVIERNRMLERIGLINAEDSTYWVVAPTTEGWNRAWEQTSQYFVYDEKVLKRDSIQQFWTNRALLDDAIFNMTDQKSVEDSLVSVPYLNWRRSWTTGKPIFHVFQHPFQQGGILNGAEAVKCSNGTLYKVSEWPFKPEETFFKEIWVEGEQTWCITEDANCVYNQRSQTADSISNNGYLQILPSDPKKSNGWKMTFRIDNTLAGDYDICLVVLPKSVYNSNNPDLRPTKFKATINYVDLQGKSQSFNCNNINFENNPEKVDTIVLAEAFPFPTCNFDQSDIKVSLKIETSIGRELTKYNREMYLDCIYLRPRKVATQNNNE